MSSQRILVFASALAAAALTAGVLIVPSLHAQTPDNALANYTPVPVRILHTGGTQPSSGYADLGQLSIPAGSYAIDAHSVISVSTATEPSQVDCFLVYPGTLNSTDTVRPNLRSVPPNAQEIGSSLDLNPDTQNNVQNLSVDAMTTTAKGGTVSLFCRAVNPADNLGLVAQHTSIVAIPVNGTTVTRSSAPPQGTY